MLARSRRTAPTARNELTHPAGFAGRDVKAMQALRYQPPRVNHRGPTPDPVANAGLSRSGRACLA